MRRLLIASLAAALLTAGCASARLYPVSGPALSQAGSLTAKLTNVPAGHGKFTVVMPDGESVEGTYKASSEKDWSIGKAADGPITIAASDWASVFEPMPSIKRMQHGEATAKGARTTLIAEFAVNGSSGKAFGVAKDNHGNLYRFEIDGLPIGETGTSSTKTSQPAKVAGGRGPG